MRWVNMLGALCIGIFLAADVTAQQPLLQIQGQPYFGGGMTLHVTAPNSIGLQVMLALGLDPLPLDAPTYTSKGPFYIGNLTSVVALGSIAGNGRLDLPFTMPPLIPGAVGIPIALQAYIKPQLSNPATLPLDTPYFTPASARVIESPEPALGALFGDRIASGDLNGDGVEDLIVGAWFEDWVGLVNSGRAYILWGPDFIGYVALHSPMPKTFGGFGGGLATADFNLDGIEDLLVGEIANPDISSDHGFIYVYYGGQQFATTPTLQVPSPGTGINAGNFGRKLVVGNFNGDSWPDIADSMSSATVSGLTYAGKVAILWGPSFSTYVELISAFPQSGDVFGRYLAVGDVNGDMIDDLIAGSGGDDVGGILNQGSMQIHLGPLLTPGPFISNPHPGLKNAYFGDYTLSADFTGDGLADIVTRDDFDTAYIFEAPTFTTIIEIRKPVSVDVHPEKGFFGYMLASGDVNGDGARDLVIGDLAEGAEAGCLDTAEGTCFVALAPYFQSFYRLTDVPLSCGSGFSATGGIAAELDGDARPELVIGAFSTDKVGIQNAGHITVFDDALLGP